MRNPVISSQHLIKMVPFRGVLLWACAYSLAAFLIFLAVRNFYDTREMYKATTENLQSQKDTLLLEKSAQEKILHNPSMKIWEKKRHHPYTQGDFEVWLSSFAKKYYVTATIQNAETKTFTGGAEECLTLHLFGMSDGDILSLVESMIEKAHNSVVIRTLSLAKREEYKDFEEFSKEHFEHAHKNPETGVFLGVLELSIFHTNIHATDGDIGGGRHT